MAASRLAGDAPTSFSIAALEGALSAEAAAGAAGDAAPETRAARDAVAGLLADWRAGRPVDALQAKRVECGRTNGAWLPGVPLAALHASLAAAAAGAARQLPAHRFDAPASTTPHAELAPAPPAAPAGEATPLPAALVDWAASGAAAALLDAATAPAAPPPPAAVRMRDTLVAVSPAEVDFGVVAAAAATAGAPPPPARVRCVHVAAFGGDAACLLLGWRLAPRWPGALTLAPDAPALVAPDGGPEPDAIALGVRLRPGTSAAAGVLLRTDGGGADGVLAASLAALVAVPRPASVARAASAAGAVCEPPGWDVVIVAASVAAAVVRPEVARALASLSPHAPPFVPDALVRLFDTPPLVLHGPPPARPRCARLPSLAARAWWEPAGAAATGPPLPAVAATGAAARMRAGAATELAGAPPRLAALARALVAEEAAAEAGAHTLFFVRAHMVGQRLPAPGARVTAAAGWPAGPPLTYRGPDLAAVAEDSLPAALLALKVPGAAEGAPALAFGDWAALRPALLGWAGVELAAPVVSVDGGHVLVALSADAVAAAGSAAAAAAAGGPLLFHVRFLPPRTAFVAAHKALGVDGVARWVPDEGHQGPGDRDHGCNLPPDDVDLWAPAAHPPPSHGDGPAHPPPSLADVVAAADAAPTLGPRALNPEQRLAVASFLLGAGAPAGAPHPPPYALAGPPGTGKTTTLVEAALRALAAAPDARVLLAAPRDFSADVLAAALGAALAAAATRAGGEGGDGASSLLPPPSSVLRACDPARPPSTSLAGALPYCELDDGAAAFVWPTLERLRAARAVVTTCEAAATFLAGPAGPWGTSDAENQPWTTFSHVLIDEAGQATAPLALAPLALAARGGRALLAGDARQLGPGVVSAEARGAGLGLSLLERWLERAATEGGGGNAAPSASMLRRSYRSSAALLTLPNRLFYGGALVAASPQAALAPPAWAPGAGPARGRDLANATLFVGVRGAEVAPGDSAAVENPVEAATVASLVGALAAAVAADPTDSSPSAAADAAATAALLGTPSPAPGDALAAAAARVAVICLTRAQARVVRALLRAAALSSVRVGTVDDMQGQEADFVFVSTVAAGGRARAAALAASLSDPRSFNVATTRARRLLVVVGDPVRLLAGDAAAWGELLRHAAGRGGFVGAGAAELEALTGRAPPDVMADEDDNPTPLDDDLGAAAARLAAMAVLGAGGEGRAFPRTQGDVDAEEEGASRVDLDQ